MTAILINLKPIALTDDQFFDLCQSNQDLDLEFTSTGELVVMSPVGGENGRSELRLGATVYNWNESSELGYTFSSSTVFRLPDGSKRSPDVAWVKASRWDILSAEERRKFPPIAPDFVIELRSSSDELEPLQNKMVEYLRNGVTLGFLIDPKNQRAEIYRPDQLVEVRSLPTVLSGEDLMPGFELAIDLF